MKKKGMRRPGGGEGRRLGEGVGRRGQIPGKHSELGAGKKKKRLTRPLTIVTARGKRWEEKKKGGGRVPESERGGRGRDRKDQPAQNWLVNQRKFRRRTGWQSRQEKNRLIEEGEGEKEGLHWNWREKLEGGSRGRAWQYRSVAIPAGREEFVPYPDGWLPRIETVFSRPIDRINLRPPWFATMLVDIHAYGTYLGTRSVVDALMLCNGASGDVYAASDRPSGYDRR